MAVAAFWLALAAVLIANRWRARHVEAERHATIRLLIEKDPHTDLGKIKDLLYPPPVPWVLPNQPWVLPANHPWMKGPDLDQRYRLMRVWGTILMIAALGPGALIVGIGLANGVSAAIPFGIGATLFCFLVGAALFFAARFVRDGAKAGEPPRDP